MSDSVRPHRRQPTRLPRPWDSPGKNTGVGCHFLLHCVKVKSESEVAQLCPILSDRMDCSLPGSSIHGICQARVLEWGAIAFSADLVYQPVTLLIQMRNLTSKLPQFVTVFNMKQRKPGALIRPEAGGQRAGKESWCSRKTVALTQTTWFSLQVEPLLTTKMHFSDRALCHKHYYLT